MLSLPQKWVAYRKQRHIGTAGALMNNFQQTGGATLQLTALPLQQQFCREEPYLIK